MTNPYGAYVTPKIVAGYPQKCGVLADFNGEPMGTWIEVASWPVQSFIGSRMYQIEATVDGVVYTGRGFGESMLYKGKRKANQR